MSLPTEELRSELRAVLRGGTERERMLGDFEELRRMMGSEGASERFAKDMVNSLKG